MKKLTLCPGPGGQIKEWKLSQKEYFGRGDNEYQKIKKKTLDWISKISKKDEIVAIPGAATTAAFITFKNFLNNKILIINTGYYSTRWLNLIKELYPSNIIYTCGYDEIDKFAKKIDWIVFVYVETSVCKVFDIKKVYKMKKKLKSKLIVDATASIGLEKHHELCDVVFFSSCKGLLGPTGLGFIGYNKKIFPKNKTDFYSNLMTHKNSMYTLGYNCMAALYLISKKHKYYLKKILFARKILLKNAIYKKNPIIGIDIKNKVKNKEKFKNVVFYIPRDNLANQLVFFLGFVKFSNLEIKKIIKKIFLIR